MNKLITKSTDYLIRRFIKDSDCEKKVTNPVLRKKYAYLEAYISIIGNFALAAVKMLLGLMLNSISLLADAAHTVSDVMTSVVVLLGFKLSNSPADEKHPYGHGRIEFIATLVIAAMLLVVGYEFGKSSYLRLLTNTPVKGSYRVALIMVVGAVFKEWMARFSKDLGERTNASALKADAWHHRTDGIASVLVAVAIISSMYGYYMVDAVLGLMVSALIVFTGISIAKDAVSKLIGETPGEEELHNIESIALSVPGVSDIHSINVHNYGCYKEISLHVLVDNKLSIVEAHDISEEVERIIESALECNATVHIEPMA